MTSLTESHESGDIIRKKLKEVFGYGQFRGNQEPIIKNIMKGRNTFVLMPTGAGKSLCYQLPAILSEGTAIVISPLIALMKNQVDQMNALGVHARVLNSTLSRGEANDVKKQALEGKVKLLYVAPESLAKEENVEFLEKVTISMVAIDEAHCISEWGHDFRPEYRRIRTIISQFGDVPVIALTATATPKVQLDIQRNLNMEAADVFKSSFQRENLYYEVRPKQQIKKQLVKYVKDRKGQAGIVYCLSRKKVEEIAEFLSVNGVKAAPYHAGLDAAVRMRHQDAFLNEDLDVIVATIAFGMGIDKPDVRFVVHYDTPKSLEGYYQETGRAGRDGIASDCLMFYSYNDILKLEKFHKDKSVTERENARLLLGEIQAYAESAICRTRQLMNYFGENFDKACGNCDNCCHPKEKFEAKEMLSLAIQTVEQTGERFGMAHLTKVLRGSKDQYVVSYGHDALDVYAKGAEESDDIWRSIFRNGILLGFFEKDIENVGVLKLTDKAKEFLREPFSVMVPKNHDYSNLGEEEEIAREQVDTKGYDEALFSLLKQLRKKVAAQKGLPPYVIFQDPSLEEMATTYPVNNDDLLQVNGVGQGKVMKFGKEFVALIKKYVADNDIETAGNVIIKTNVTRSKDKVLLIQQVDKKTNLDELAESRGGSFDKLLDELESICFSGTKINIDYFIDDLLDEESQEEIIEYFLESETDDIDEAMDEFGDEYDEDELRLVRLKFISDTAN
ncbi:ATP-dependent DNA helicase RecQ [Fulvitalea axinellae]|uniref:DNA helicase RecQ n=1 Tax=Fulvitalea axinellae TaxID=1182444 RepID=A0AAU9CHH7_9BACT|nr:ATP-dependent DNA helicase RecQ [Fulvitalea axinellae]